MALIITTKTSKLDDDLEKVASLALSRDYQLPCWQLLLVSIYMFKDVVTGKDFWTIQCIFIHISCMVYSGTAEFLRSDFKFIVSHI